MKHFKCENCGSDLVKCADNAYVCDYCKREYYDDSLEKAYERVYRNLQVTIDGIVSEKLMEQRIEQLANCRQALYKARNGQFIDSKEVEKWSGEILKLSPDDVQANFYGIACKKRWIDLNKFMQKLNARENSYLVEGFVDYLTNGQFVEKCVLALNDLISRAFDENSKEFSNCHKKINKAVEEEESGIFDAELSRDVFVAYSSKDKDEAYKLVEYLEKNGLSCFIAMRNLAKGVDAEHKYNERLKKAIDNCQVFVLVSSKNSRSRDCDAYNIEMRYVKERDISRAENREYANAHYELYLEKNRRRCKPRVEYLIDKYENGLYDKEVKKFFGGLTWCTSLNSVGKVVFDYIENGTVDDEEEKLAKQRAEIEEERKKLEKKEKELSRKQAEQAGSIDDLYKAFKQRERDEEEQRRKEELERKAKAELERQRKIQEEIERQREVEREQKEAETRALKEKEEAERRRKEEEERKRQAELEAKRKLQQEERRRRKEQEEFERTFSIKGNTLMEYNGESAICVVPDNVKDFHSKCFSNAKHLEKVVLPTSITKINNSLFKGLKNLKSVECRGQVTEIGNFAFSGCTKLAEFNIPKTVTSIGRNAFENCSNLTKISLPDGLNCLPEKMFKGCKNLTDIIIPETVKSVGERAFEDCVGLTDIEFPKNITSFGEGVLNNCCNLESLAIPYLLEAKNTEFNSFFSYLFGVKPIISLKSLKLLAGEKIDGKAFDCVECVESIEISASVVTIENCVFDDLTNLTRIEVAKGNKKYRSMDGNLYTKDGKTLLKYATGKKDKEFKVPDGVVIIECGAFGGVEELERIEIPASTLSIDVLAFEHLTSLNNITVDENNKNYKSIDGNLYVKDGKTLVKVANKQKTEFTIPEGVIVLERDAFSDCKALTKLVIPHSVNRIRSGVFSGCEKLKEIHISNVPAWCNICFEDRSANPLRKNADLYLDGGLVTDLVIPEGVTEIKEYAFDGWSKLQSVSIPASVWKIEDSAFNGCGNLKEVRIQGKKVQMTEETFEGCENLSARSIKSIARQFPLRTKIKLWAVWFRLFLFSFSSLVLEKWESFTERVEDWFDPIWEKIESFMKKVGDLLEPVFSFFDDCCVGISNFAERVSEFIGDISEKRKNLIIAISVGVLLVGGIVAVVLLLEWSVAWIILQCLIGILLGAFVLLTPSSALDYRGAL